MRCKIFSAWIADRKDIDHNATMNLSEFQTELVIFFGFIMAIVWIIFPFVVMRRLGRIVELLESGGKEKEQLSSPERSLRAN
jgi:hypothetical protein